MPKHYYTEHEPTGDRLGVGCADCTTDRKLHPQRQAFLAAMREFLRAGSALVQEWDNRYDAPEWNADEEFGQPLIDAEGMPENGQPLFPLSFDEWLTEMYAHYFKDEEEGGA